MWYNANVEKSASHIAAAKSAAGCNLGMTERHVQAIWFDPHLRPKELFTASGQFVRVIDPGTWNLEAGPDFKDALLEVGDEGRIVAGDVEVHIVPADWTAHGHSANILYRNVMAHVTWKSGAHPRDLPQEVLEIPLEGAYGKFIAGMIDVDAYPYAVPPPYAGGCAENLAKADLGDKMRLLENAGRRRLAAKARAIGPTAGLDVFYRLFMEAMGWKANTLNFRKLAEILPWNEIPRNAAQAFVHLHGAAILVKWNIAGTRPNNRPEARFGAIARVCSNLEEFVESLAACDWSSRKGVSRAIKIIAGDGVELPFPAKLGRGRSAAVAANVVWPFLHATGRAGAIAWLPPEDESSIMRETVHRLFGRDSSPAAYSSNGLHMQGLIAISKEYCAAFRPSCAGCPLDAGRTGAVSA